jgi:hypothetical protein
MGWGGGEGGRVYCTEREREKESRRGPWHAQQRVGAPCASKKEKKVVFFVFFEGKKEEYTHTRHIKQHHTRTHATKSKTIHKQSRALVGMKGWT